MQHGRGFKIAVGVLFPLFVLAVFALAIIYRSTWLAFFSSRSDVQEWIAAYGAVAPLVYIGVQVFQVVIFIVPGEVIQVTGGYLFGIMAGTIYSLIGIALGSGIDFYLARLLGRAFVEGVFGDEQVARFDTFTSARGPQTGFFLLFVIPGIPKDVLVYVAGISTIRFPYFLIVTMSGRLPGIVGSAIIGDSVADGRWVLGAIVFGVSVVLFVLGVVFRARLVEWVRRVLKRRSDEE
ncbi:MAG: TVP38/TMEM64 family protein [Spirochaetia bacterium]